MTGQKSPWAIELLKRGNYRLVKQISRIHIVLELRHTSLGRVVRTNAFEPYLSGEILSSSCEDLRDRSMILHLYHGMSQRSPVIRNKVRIRQKKMEVCTFFFSLFFFLFFLSSDGTFFFSPFFFPFFFILRRYLFFPPLFLKNSPAVPFFSLFFPLFFSFLRRMGKHRA